MPAIRRNKLTEFFWRAHTSLYRVSRGRVGGKVTGMPVVVLHTKGRRSGQRRINALAYFKDNGNFLVVASNTGEPRQPAWWLNLRQMTETEIELRGRLRPVHPREAGGDERERLWSRLVAINRDYDVYQRRTNRQIPVVVLEPLSQRR